MADYEAAEIAINEAAEMIAVNQAYWLTAVGTDEEQEQWLHCYNLACELFKTLDDPKFVFFPHIWLVRASMLVDAFLMLVKECEKKDETVQTK